MDLIGQPWAVGRRLQNLHVLIALCCVALSCQPAATTRSSTTSAPEQRTLPSRAPSGTVLPTPVHGQEPAPAEPAERKEDSVLEVEHPEARRCRVAAIGDSLTDSRSGGGKFLRYLQERCPQSSFRNLGVGGEMVNQMRRRLLQALSSAAPPGAAGEPPGYTHVILFGGVNDLYSDLTAQRSVDKITRDLAWMYQQAAAAGAEVVAITVAPWGGFRRYFNPRRSKTTLELNAWIQAQEGQTSSAVIDAYGLLSCGDAQRLCPRYAEPFKDGLHFGPEGHRVIADSLYEKVFHACR